MHGITGSEVSWLEWWIDIYQFVLEIWKLYIEFPCKLVYERNLIAELKL